MALSYKPIVEGNDPDNTMSEHKKERIQMKARYLAQAYQIAIKKMPFKTWNDCCWEAINRFAAVQIHYTKNAKVLECWIVQFCEKKTFCVKIRGKMDLPTFLDAHPIVVTVMKEYRHANLSELSIKMMHSNLHETIIKSLVTEHLKGKRASKSEYKEEKLKLLHEYALKCLSHSMTHHWMLQLGFRYETAMAEGILC
jgi:hypothetical protein